MEENLKNRIILILAVANIILFLGSLGSCNHASRQKAVRQRETITRFNLQEQMDKLMKEKAALESRLKLASQGLEEEKTAHELDKKTLQEKQIVIGVLEAEIERLGKLKDHLENDLKEALTAGSKVVKPEGK